MPKELELFGDSGGELALFDEEVARAKKVRENYSKELATVYSNVIGVGYNEAKEIIDLGLETRFAEESRARALTSQRAEADLQFKTDVMTGQPVEDIQARVKDNEKTEDLIQNTESPEIAAPLYSNKGSAWDEAERRASTRLATVSKVFEEQLDQADTSVWGYGWAVADLLASGIPDVLSGGGFTRGNYAEKIMSLVHDETITEEEFNTQVKQMVQEVADTGWLSDNNPLFTSDFHETVKEGGKGPNTALDKLFTGAEVALGASALARAAKTGTKAITGIRDGADSTMIFSGQEQAVNVTADAMRSGRGSVNAPQRMFGDPWLKPGTKRDFPLISPDAEALHRVEFENKYWDILKRQDFGEFLDRDVLAEQTPKLLERMWNEISKTETRRINNIQLEEDNLGNLFGVAYFGKADGTAIKSGRTAEKQAKKLGGEVITAGVVGGEPRFLVKLTRNLPTKGLNKSTDPNELATHIFQAFGSTYLTTSMRLDPIIKRGEAGLGNVYRKVADDYNKKFRTAKRIKTPSGMRAPEVVGKIMEGLRDSEDAFRRAPYTVNEFRDKYYELAGVMPQQQVIDYYTALQDFNDVDYLIRADDLFKEAVNRGEEVVSFKNAEGTDTKWRVMRSNHSEGDEAYNPVTGEVVELSDEVDGTPFRVVGGYQTGDKTWERVILPSDFNWTRRRLYHNDVLGYNPGGHREYRDMKWLVKQESTFKIGGKRTRQAQGKPLTFMGTVTEGEARAAAKSINSIMGELTRGLRRGATKRQARDFVRAQTGDPELDEFIRRNNDWNLDIEDTQDFLRFVDEFDLDPRKPVGIAAHNEGIRLESNAGDFELLAGFSPKTTYGEAFSLYNNPTGGRRNKVLKGYGGNYLETRTPIKRTENSFVRSVQNLSNRPYLNQAINGWLKGAKPDIDNWDKLQGLPLIKQLELADLSEATANGKKFAQERRVIQRRLSHKSEIQQRIENKMTDVADWVYEKGYKSTSQRLRDQTSKDPTVALRSIAFNLKLGLFAFDQLLVQSSQAFNIAAIAGPRDWTKIAAMPILMRMGALNGNNKVIWEIAERTKSFTGIGGDEFVRMNEFMLSTGRQHIDRTVIEQSAGDFALGKGMLNRGLRAGRFFFNEGELIPREAAFVMAWKRFHRQFPSADPFSDAGKNWIMREQDVLSAGMTQSSAAAWQKNGFSIPLQFMSYTSRMMEQLFTGNFGGRAILSPGDRRRLAVGQLLFWGAGGAGMAGTVDWMIENGYMPGIDDNVYTALRYGMLDGTIDLLTSSDTAFATRLGVMEGATQMYERVFDDATPWYEIAGGPGTRVASDVLGTMWTAIGQTLTGSWDVAELDFSRALRNASSFNRAYQSWYIAKLGDYYSRTNNLVASNLSASDALFNALGAPLQKVEMAYDRFQAFEDEEDMLKQHGNRIRDKVRVMRGLIAEGDMEEAKEVNKEIAELYQVLPPHQQRRMRIYMQPESDGMFGEMMRKTIERHSHFADLMIQMEEEGQ